MPFLRLLGTGDNIPPSTYQIHELLNLSVRGLLWSNYGAGVTHNVPRVVVIAGQPLPSAFSTARATLWRRAQFQQSFRVVQPDLPTSTLLAQLLDSLSQ
ncbi:MAG: hypothetical protein LC794_20275 [Acidobacteria bacterium]|nr:hypothetical protein [Acidobacteriota bacterium]